MVMICDVVYDDYTNKSAVSCGPLSGTSNPQVTNKSLNTSIVWCAVVHDMCQQYCTYLWLFTVSI